MEPEQIKAATSDLLLPPLLEPEQTIEEACIANTLPPEDGNNTVWAIEGQSFPYKLRCIVDDPTFSQYIRWSEDGTAIVFPNFDNFVMYVLKRKINKIFKTESLKSFVRQLNLYGFHKVPLEKSPPEFSDGCLLNQKMPDAVFKHAKFLRSRPDLLEHVKRRCHVKARRDRHDLTYYAQETPMDASKLQQVMTDTSFYANNPRPLKRRLSFENERFPVQNHWTMLVQQQEGTGDDSENCMPLPVAVNQAMSLQLPHYPLAYDSQQQISVPLNALYYQHGFSLPQSMAGASPSLPCQSPTTYDQMINQLLTNPNNLAVATTTGGTCNTVSGSVLSSSPRMATTTKNSLTPSTTESPSCLPTINESFFNNISPLSTNYLQAGSLLATPTTNSLASTAPDSSPSVVSKVYSSLSPLSAFCASLFSPLNEHQSSASKSLQQQIFSSKALSILAEEAVKVKSDKNTEIATTNAVQAEETRPEDYL